MDKTQNIRDKIKKYWLSCLIAAQPVLDVVAFWTAGSASTVSGYLRLLVMLALPLYLLITLRRKGRFIAIMAAMGVYSALHIASCARAGYISPAFDIAYLVRVLQMPVLAVCFIYLVRDESTKAQAVRGLWTAGLLLLGFLAVSIVTGSYTETYQGIGISGWVPEDNRCANSIIMVTLSVFAMYFAAKTNSRAAQLAIPTVISAVFLSNGTKACYAALFVLFIGFAVFELMNRLINGVKIKKAFVAWLLVLATGAVLVYPYTPRAEAAGRENSDAKRREEEFKALLIERGYDYYSLSHEQILDDPELMALLYDYYSIVRFVNPDMFERFGFERVLARYGFTLSQELMIDYRFLKRSYARLIWEDSDTLTRLFGIEVTEICTKPYYDLENDWPALYYYYGYVGMALYCAFMLYFLYLVLRKMLLDFRGAFTLFNYSLLMCIALQLALAQLSGALLRRPNASVYLSLLLALVYLETAGAERDGLREAEE